MFPNGDGINAASIQRNERLSLKSRYSAPVNLINRLKFTVDNCFMVMACIYHGWHNLLLWVA